MKKLHFILCLCIFQILLVLSIRADKCSPSKLIIKQLENQYEVKISDLSHNITFDYDENIVFTNETTTNVTEIYLRKVGVNFTGHFLSKESNHDYIHTKFDAEAIRVHHLRQKRLLFGKNKYYCKVADLDHSQLRLNSTKAELIVNSLTKICIEDSICKQYTAFTSHYFSRTERRKAIPASSIENNCTLQKSKSRSASKSDKNEASCSDQSSMRLYNPQNTINTIFDFAISAIVSLLANNDTGVMDLPFIEKDYKFAGSTGEFQAFNGTFEDLRALYRVKDLVFTNNKNRFMVATAIHLDKAKLIFPLYRLRYGFIKLNGHLKVDIDGLTTSLKLAVDYNASPCELELVEMNLDEMGDTSVNFSGLGWPINSAVKLVIQYIVKHKVFQTARDIAAEQIKELNCEQFRPSTQPSTHNGTFRSINEFLLHNSFLIS